MMDPVHLRDAIVRAAMPLMAEYDTLTTARIADAAGIDEATLLRVFDDTDAVLGACWDAMKTSIAAALDPSRVLQELDAISVDQPLAARLVEAIDALDAYYVGIRTDMAALHDSFSTAGERRTRPVDGDDFRAAGRLPEARHAIARLLAPDHEHLRLPADVLADAFLGMSLGAARTPHPDRSPLPSEQLVDLFLHGASRHEPR
jgi:AcrR family transcriptional regulator